MTKSELKEALIEVLETNPEIIENALLNSLEDAGMVNAIKEGDKKNYIEFEKFMEYLDDKLNSAKTDENQS